MAEVTIRLTVNPETGKKRIVVSSQSDMGSLPMEHEDDHRNIVDKLIEGGAFNAANLGQMIVDREGGQSIGEDEINENAVSERESVEQSS